LLKTSLGEISVIPIADESLGVRSMCTFVETPNVGVLIDPGVSLGSRFFTLPHPLEYEALKENRDRIEKYADQATVITISHYHFDHITPTFTDYTWNWSSLEAAKRIFHGKLVLAKSARSKINPSQRRRGWLFKKTTREFLKEIHKADGVTFDFEKTQLKFSEPVFHGEEDTFLGWVVMLTISYNGKKVMHASDVQGPMSDKTLNKILIENPDLLLIGGPPSYLTGFKINEKAIQKGIKNLSVLAERIPSIIIMHHLLRDEKWKELSKPVFNAAKKFGHKVVTAAEFMGKPNKFLEFKRETLYKTKPPDDSFIKWTKLPRLKQKKTPPPL